MPQHDNLLQDEDDSGAFDADPRIPDFDPDPSDDSSSVVTVEPKVIQIGRHVRNEEMRTMQQELGGDQRGSKSQVLPKSVPPLSEQLGK